VQFLGQHAGGYLAVLLQHVEQFAVHLVERCDVWQAWDKWKFLGQAA
jgi:hypothetical protein